MASNGDGGDSATNDKLSKTKLLTDLSADVGKIKKA